MVAERSDVQIEEPQAALERAFIDEYLRSREHDPHTLSPEQVKSVLRDAALYAAAKLAELEARAHYIHEIHGASSHR